MAVGLRIRTCLVWLRQAKGASTRNPRPQACRVLGSIRPRRWSRQSQARPAQPRPGCSDSTGREGVKGQLPGAYMLGFGVGPGCTLDRNSSTPSPSASVRGDTMRYAQCSMPHAHCACTAAVRMQTMGPKKAARFIRAPAGVSTGSGLRVLPVLGFDHRIARLQE